jgi:uncharacterized repeat protein (TIGR04076 family)
MCVCDTIEGPSPLSTADDGTKYRKGGYIMAEPAKVILKVLSVNGRCDACHSAGQEFDLSGDITLGYSGKPGVICQALFYSIYPAYRTLKFGGSLPWEKDPDVAHVVCSDPFNPVVVELIRVKE